MFAVKQEVAMIWALAEVVLVALQVSLRTVRARLIQSRLQFSYQIP